MAATGSTKKAQEPTRETVKHVIIGTAGHVDHGKTTLIQALTGTNPDRLAEEQARGMTIDLGFAFLDLPGEDGMPISAGIVDVPGHERFVKNMLAGAGGVDVALLVVASDEGPMPQTREHLDILTVLGVSSGVVALTKSDLADPDLADLVAETTREMLAVTPLKGASLVSVSAATGQGMDELRQALAHAIALVPLRSAFAPFRLPVDRVFSLPGVGTVATGTLVQGTLHTGDAVVVQPQNLDTRARTVQTHNNRIEQATPGMRVAVNLPGVEVGQIERGAVLCPPGTQTETYLLDVQLSLLADAPRPLKHRERVRLHLGTGELLARVLLLEESELTPGSAPIGAQVLCETPAAPARGERFVLRTYSPARAIGGGIVLDPHPPRKYQRGDMTAYARFDAYQTNNMTETVYAALTARHEDYAIADIARTTSVSEDAVANALKELTEQGRAVVLVNGRVLSDVAAQRLIDTARRTLTTYHRQNPYKRAMPQASLFTPLKKAAVVQSESALRAWLVERGALVLEGDNGVRQPEHQIVLPKNWQEPAHEIADVYRVAGFNPPLPSNFAANFPRDVIVPAILSALAEMGELVPIEGELKDLYLHRDVYNTLPDILKTLSATPEGITVGGFRNLTNSSRKIILPLLESLDARGVTRRVGDTRVLLQKS